MLRNTLATLAYRGGKTIRDVDQEFADFRPAAGSRTPVEILAHIGDLLDWAVQLAGGKHVFHESKPLPWDQEVARFFRVLRALDQRLASGEALGFPAEKLFQGPV